MIFTVTWYFNLIIVTSWMPLLWVSEQQILSWMMDKFINCPKPYLLLSGTCDEILSWMIEI